MIRAIAIVLASARLAAADDWEVERTGLVVEGALGGGVVHHGAWSPIFSVFAQSAAIARFEVPAVSTSLGVGGWLTPHLALTGHLVAIAFRDPAVARRGVTGIVGPHLQHWLPPLTGALTDRPTLWLGGGAGLAILAGSERAVGFGLDVRIGYALGAVQLALEGTEAVFDLQRDTVSVIFTVGYQVR